MKVVDFYWTTEMIRHLAKHEVTPDEVIEVFESAPFVLQVEEIKTDESPFYTVVGYTANGRLLEVHGTLFKDPPLKNYWFTATAMDARPRWRAEYLKAKGGEKR